MILYSEEDIAKMVGRVADEIFRDYGETDLVLVIILKGAAWFGTDLSRALERRRKTDKLYVEFMRVGSYGEQQVSSGDVQIIMDVGHSLQGRDVIIVEDVAETCQTLGKLVRHLQGKGPSSLKVCVAVDKSAGRGDVKLDYVGFAGAKGFLVGYGMDDKGAARGVPYIYTVEEAV